jgi:hypothetical protein
MPSEGRRKYFENVVEEQNKTPRFSTVDRRAEANQNNNNSGRPAGNINTTPNAPVKADPSRRRQSDPAQPNENRVRKNSSRDRNMETHPQQQPQQKQQQEPPRQNETWTPRPSTNPGSGSEPRRSSGGGNSRPR